MAEMRSWQGDWHARIYERAKAKGYDSVTAFAEARPRAAPLALAEELGPDDVNAAQVLAILRAEAEQGRFVDRFARSLLVHELHETMPKGWRVDPGDGFEFDFKAASAIARFITELPESHHEMASSVGDIMMAADLPVGWLPEGPDDSVLVALFEKARGGPGQ